ncbi:Uma2 family endonuclease [Spirulina sp. 06S082]|uniref:Uma2 family endonuclease n=1 Tax=Spirulina sp. 06S082 TaxID=3110248 RepID=UPI002B1F74C0|nr:Uma2 family endonuclease [Spirulina sp. 06S082]MEA5469445.1 Uma2 family endonuclease [Spirulina sp. 06S082]
MVEKPVPESPAIATELVFPLQGISWPTYKALMRDVGEDRAWRIAYHRELLELRMPHLIHEELKGFLESLVEIVADELEIELRKLGSVTLEREDLGFAIEPDACFYIDSEEEVRGKTIINLLEDPPPDLAIEADYEHSSLDKFSIYEAFGIPEIWRYSDGELQVYQLIEGKYQKCDRSLTFSFLPIAEIPDYIEKSKKIGQRAAFRSFRKEMRYI